MVYNSPKRMASERALGFFASCITDKKRQNDTQTKTRTYHESKSKKRTEGDLIGEERKNIRVHAERT